MIKPALMFQDHMILQREKRVQIWGQSDPGAEISICIQGKEATCQADQEGNWWAEIGPLETSFEESLKISTDKEELILSDVQVGDVYLAAGQSNMEFFMRYDMDLEEEIKNCENDRIRFFDYPEVAYPGQINEADYGKNFGFWRKACPQDLEWFSAVGYYFAKDIQRKYEIPVGILGCNWGGTPACAWMSREAILAGGGKAWLDTYEEGLKTLDMAAYEAQFQANPTSYNVDPFHDPFTDMLMRGASILDIIKKLTGQDPDPSMGENFTAPPVGPKTATRPCGLYESMLKMVAPYTLKGILFYQGESDGDVHPELYATLFPALIQCFRDLWREALPFLFVQVAPFGSWMMSTGEPYVEIRYAQQLASETVPGTGMAVITDVGMELDIHPKKKQPVGHRLALQAMNRIYQEKDLLCEAPTLVGGEVKGDDLILFFDHAGEGLCLKEETPDQEKADPTMAGGLRIYVDGQELSLPDIQAEASANTFVLHSPAFSDAHQVKVELGWRGWYRINLYNSADIPARPARVTIQR